MSQLTAPFEATLVTPREPEGTLALAKGGIGNAQERGAGVVALKGSGRM